MGANEPLTVIVEKHVWVASDGTEFATQEAAQEYEDIMTNPYYKTLKDKVEQLERTIEHLKHDLEISRARNDFLRPQPYFGDIKGN